MLKTFCNKNLLEAGVDEAGRGPLFGRVYTAAVIIPPDETFHQKFIKDSKKLSEKNREFAFEFIKEHAIDWRVHYKDEKYIDTKDPACNCLDVAIITSPEKRSQKTIDKLKNIAGRVLNK